MQYGGNNNNYLMLQHLIHDSSMWQMHVLQQYQNQILLHTVLSIHV